MHRRRSGFLVNLIAESIIYRQAQVAAEISNFFKEPTGELNCPPLYGRTTSALLEQLRRSRVQPTLLHHRAQVLPPPAWYYIPSRTHTYVKAPSKARTSKTTSCNTTYSCVALPTACAQHFIRRCWRRQALAGYYKAGTTATQCPAGAYCPQASTAPQGCPAGTGSPPGASDVTACMVGESRKPHKTSQLELNSRFSEVQLRIFFYCQTHAHPFLLCGHSLWTAFLANQAKSQPRAHRGPTARGVSSMPAQPEPPAPPNPRPLLLAR